MQQKERTNGKKDSKRKYAVCPVGGGGGGGVLVSSKRCIFWGGEELLLEVSDLLFLHQRALAECQGVGPVSNSVTFCATADS